MNDTSSRWSAIGLYLIALHVLALFAFVFFSWYGVAISVFLVVATGLGVTLGYHRYLTHRGFETSRPVRYFLSILGLLSGEGPPLMWVAVHRKHHQFSDKEGDPHSPALHGFWHAHIGWMLWSEATIQTGLLLQRYARDLYEEPFMRFLNRTYVLWHVVLALTLFLSGWMIESFSLGMSFLVYGVFVRMVVVLHSTWFVNSATHVWGYRNYQETRDNSRNLWWVAILSFGEGWHNNHHAHPSLAKHGHKWWEIDTTYWMIWFLSRIGVIWNVQDRLPKL